MVTEAIDAMERALVIIKPDAVARGLIGEVISRLERKGLGLIGLKMMRVSKRVAEKLYAAHRGKEFYQPLVNFLTSAPVVALAVEGLEANATVRKLMGTTFSREAEPGSIRGDLGMSRRFNLVHGSESAEVAEKELGLFFQDDEYHGSQRAEHSWIYDWQTGEPV